MSKPSLLVRAVDAALVQDYSAMEGGIRRFINRTFNEGESAWYPNQDPTRIASNDKFYSEYVQALRLGDLEAADPETARVARTEWPPSSFTYSHVRSEDFPSVR